MSAPKRKREVQVNFRVSPEELALIEKKMSQLGTNNREAYLRKMAWTVMASAAGLAGAEGAGIPAAPGQQQSEPAHPRGAWGPGVSTTLTWRI